MKIEPRKDHKKPAYVVAASLLAAATLISSCGEAELEGTAEPVYLEGETQVFLDGAGTPLDTCFPDPDRSVSSSEASLKSETDDEYGMFLNKIQEIEDTCHGQYLFSITSVYDEVRDGSFDVLTAWNSNNESPVHMVISGGDWMIFDDEDVNDISMNSAITYEEIMTLPYILDTRALLHSEAAEDGMETGLPTAFTDEPEDGMYAGRIIGVEDNGYTALMCIGEPVYFYRDQIESLEMGDDIGLYDLKISETLGSTEEGSTLIALESEYLTDLCLTVSPTDNNVFYLTGPEGICIRDAFIVEAEILPSCEISDDCQELYGSEGEISGFALTDSYFWYYVNDQGEYCENGWIAVDAQVTELEIVDNTVTMLVIDCADDSDVAG